MFILSVISHEQATISENICSNLATETGAEKNASLFQISAN